MRIMGLRSGRRCVLFFSGSYLLLLASTGFYWRLLAFTCLIDWAGVLWLRLGLGLQLGLGLGS